MPTLALCVICHDRPDELQVALESAPGFDEVIVVDMASDPPLTPIPGTRWIRRDENEGVTQGRNRLADAAGSDILVFLDDDARFLDVDAGERIREVFAARPALGALAFLIERPGGAVLRHEQPFRGRPRRIHEARPCAYFLGGAVAIRRDAYLDAGGFDPRFVYSTEELDLAFGIAALGLDLFYEPSIRVEHNPSARGRSLDPQVPALRLRNRILLARRHLPVAAAVPHVGAWGLRTFLESLRARRIRPWLRAWPAGFRLPVERAPLRARQLRTLHKRGGHVWW